MSALVSIVIPFFNEEQYLQRALDSAVRQRYTPVEIILVNDGSTDASLRIAEEYQSCCPYMRIISTENRGLGHARNTGMAVAEGTYLTFLDADDALKEDALSVWVQKMESGDADIVIGKFDMVNLRDKHNRIPAGWKGEGAAGTGADGVRAMYEYRMASTAWAKLYRSHLAKQLRFPEGLWFEDRPFLLHYFLLAQKIVYEKSSQLDILSRQHSITRSLISERRIKDAYAVYQLELQAVAAHPQQRAYTRLIDRHQINAMLEALIILYYDRKGHPGMDRIKACYREYVAAFVKQLNKNGTRIGMRDRADMLLIRLHRFIGWRLASLLLPLWKNKKCKAVLKLKSF